MSLPTFLGIGVQRGGSTWLHALLGSHPEVYMPSRRKEVRFFDREFERGLDWYETFFPDPRDAENYRAIGEISPQYYKSDPCPERIFGTLPDSKLIISLRHPVNRAYSVYGFHVQRRGFNGSFEDFLAARPEILEQGRYGRYMQRYLRYFDRTRILVLVFENAVTNVPKTTADIAEFLNIAPDKFPTSAGSEKVNGSSVPRHRFLYSLAVRMGHRLRARGMDRAVDFVRRLEIERFLAKGSPMPPLDGDLKDRLSESYQDDFDELEDSLGLDLSCWRDRSLCRNTGDRRLRESSLREVRT